MSVRLSIVLESADARFLQAAEIEGELVGQLMGSPGMDLNLIGSLRSITESHTDRLLLEGLSGDFALVGWRSPDECLATLAALGIPGLRAPHALDPDVPLVAGRRKVYLLDARSASAEALIGALRQILSARRTQTVSLAGLVPKPPAASTASAKPHASEGQIHNTLAAGNASSLVTSSTDNRAHDLSSQPKKVMPPAQPQIAPPLPVEPQDSAALDALVDDLNASDI